MPRPLNQKYSLDQTVDSQSLQTSSPTVLLKQRRTGKAWLLSKTKLNSQSYTGRKAAASQERHLQFGILSTNEHLSRKVRAKSQNAGRQHQTSVSVSGGATHSFIPWCLRGVHKAASEASCQGPVQLLGAPDFEDCTETLPKWLTIQHTIVGQRVPQLQNLEVTPP